ncbi:DUF1749-domain-containing protein [Ceraceosorus guamensis]|uniref:DUF1749-domain-containing protein n=1 Tax=Ceraceosorus guamensis TaxID=1522189 RepID=A0A316VZ10_9BASI|nr:DUF1749-domain-containing protein [Ceraceosorus guamensis]PWN42897.1 DUF1749-domain-containing protein [Ceraceosorus guamensis]
MSFGSSESTPAGHSHEVRWSLSTYGSPKLTLLDSDPGATHSIVLIPGLTDTIGSLPYTEGLVEALSKLGISVVLPQLSSNLGGFNYGSLEADAREIAAVVDQLRAASKKKAIFLLGHSTGCQDVITYLLGNRGADVKVQGAIIQAPCSDRLYFDKTAGAEEVENLKEATSLVQAGKGSTLLSYKAPLAPRPARAVNRHSGEPRGTNESAILEPPQTAYRYWSLNGKGGDDDLFSGDFEEKDVIDIFRNALDGLAKDWASPEGIIAPGDPELLALCGSEDEYMLDPYPASVIVDKWNRIVKDTRFKAKVLQGANHKVDAAPAQAELIKEVAGLCARVLDSEQPALAAATSAISNLTLGSADLAREQQAPQHPASFDAIVELISTGQADKIPGIKDIPLQINRATPSESHLKQPPKPWEHPGGVSDSQ